MPVPPSPPSIAPVFSPAAPTDIVSFTVICQPATPMNADEFRSRLAAASIEDLRPEPAVLARVAAELRGLGFEVFEQTASPIVIASGPVARFEEVFSARLTRMTRPSPYGDQTGGITGIVLARGSEKPRADAIPFALIVSVPDLPMLAGTPATSNTATPLCLELQTGVAHRIGAAAAAQLKRPFASASLPKKECIRVAVIDTGFADHDFFAPFKVTRLPSNHAPDPDVDNVHHGTYVLANLLACAPNVDAYAVKFYDDIPSALAVALSVAGMRIISLSWFWPADANPDLSGVDGIRLQILDAISKGVTVIVASGNFSLLTFPAMMPEVIAIGGVAIKSRGGARAWPGTAAFAASSSREVPDLCGIASQINVPWPFNGNLAEMQCREGETSCATPQVAAVAALLYEKNGSLTPFEVKAALMLGAKDVVGGTTYGGSAAVAGPDLATGRGLVDAVASWQLVP
jgi:hypothetical protein